MNLAFKTKWVEALRSGKYEQGHDQLRSGDCFCCLGVLCDLVKSEVDGVWKNNQFSNADSTFSSLLPYIVRDYVNLHSTQITDILMNMNDQESKSFNEIADWIDANL